MKQLLTRTVSVFLLMYISACGGGGGGSSEPPIPATTTLSITLNGNGIGTITSSPVGILCGADCSEVYTIGTTITLTAVANSNSVFTGWSGGGCSGSGMCTVTLSTATDVTATFTLKSWMLNTMLDGTGSGTVASNPAGVNCGPTCQANFDDGTNVTLTATPDSQSIFVGWSGICTGSSSCNVSMDADRTATATFHLQTYGLTLIKSGNGSGTVTSNPAGINCGVDCSEAYTTNTVVTLSAAPSAGSSFIGWSGGGCTGTGTCTVTVSSAQSVTAAFTLNLYTLTVSKSGTGGGTVTTSPAGISCGADCSQAYNYGTSVVLTATADSVSSFAGWSGGGCSGTGPCTLPITAATTVNARFDNATSYTINGSWSCAIGVSCQDVYDFTLTAGSSIAIYVTGVTGSSVLRLAVFNPGVALSGTDLLTGLNYDRRCTGQNIDDSVNFLARTTGTYRIVVGRDWGNSAGSSGSYTLTVNSGLAMQFITQSANDIASSAVSTQCGYIYSVVSSWACATGVSCQDVFDFNTIISTPVTIGVTSVSGSSVVRMALFDGSALNSVNRLNNTYADRRCVAQNGSDIVTSGILPAGLHRMAIGRDWGTSAGASGVYLVTLSTNNAPLSIVGQTANDTASLFTATTCP